MKYITQRVSTFQMCPQVIGGYVKGNVQNGRALLVHCSSPSRSHCTLQLPSPSTGPTYAKEWKHKNFLKCFKNRGNYSIMLLFYNIHTFNYLDSLINMQVWIIMTSCNISPIDKTNNYIIIWPQLCLSILGFCLAFFKVIFALFTSQGSSRK